MDDSREKAALESTSKQYLEPDSGRAVDQEILSMVADAILPWATGPDVLELGFGDDVWTSGVIKAFGHSSIVDGSQILLDQAARIYGDKIETHNELFESFEPPRKYDTIIASFVLEHVTDPVEVLRKASTWINEDGHILVVVPNADSFHRRAAVCMGILKTSDEIGATDKQVGHRRVYTLEKIERDIALAGLVAVRRRGLFLKFIPQGMMSGFSDELLRGYMELSASVPTEYCAIIALDCVLKQPLAEA